jgi:peroxiredoxin Q/BCP
MSAGPKPPGHRREAAHAKKKMYQAGVVDDFELPDASGTARRLTSLLANGPIVLFFYPAALSYGCTKEACHFRDLAGELAAVGARAVGISTDPPEVQRRFDERYGLGFVLLSDVEGAVARAFGVKRRFGPLPVKRATFVIAPDRRLLGVIASELRMDHHVEQALSILKAWRAQSGTSS